MFSFANVVHLLPHKLSRLGAGRFAFAGIFMSAFQSFFFRHEILHLQHSHAKLQISIEPILYAPKNLAVKRCGQP